MVRTPGASARCSSPGLTTARAPGPSAHSSSGLRQPGRSVPGCAGGSAPGGLWWGAAQGRGRTAGVTRLSRRCSEAGSCHPTHFPRQGASASGVSIRSRLSACPVPPHRAFGQTQRPSTVRKPLSTCAHRPLPELSVRKARACTRVEPRTSRPALWADSPDGLRPSPTPPLSLAQRLRFVPLCRSAESEVSTQLLLQAGGFGRLCWGNRAAPTLLLRKRGTRASTENLSHSSQPGTLLGTAGLTPRGLHCSPCGQPVGWDWEAPPAFEARGPA
ncbi:PREDICTED: uncharacterized protein LOC106148570 [Chinchilla lanigera]|uniref:uncharacterized protein LOC106148570 n=1 Tax=Chinchilla lanigera TaxID=34839 RepID=UPI000698EA0B|nr:PREDICTED: uncharacterized protein LOC106148570 [Chinchilla lanigera]